MLTEFGRTPMITTGCDSMGGNWIWAFLLFAILGNGNGFGGNNSNQIYASQQFNQLDNGIRSINNGLCDSTYSLTNSIKDGNYNTAMAIQGVNTNLGNAICSQTYDITSHIRDLSSKIDNCCCTTQRSIDAVMFNNERNTNAIIQAGNADTQRILDYLSAKELSDKNQRIFEMSQRAQTLEIINAQKPQAAIPAYIQPSPYEAYYPTSPVPRYTNYTPASVA